MRTTFLTRWPLGISPFVAACLLAALSPVQAQSTWTNGTTGNATWSTVANWTGGVPVSGNATTVNFFDGATGLSSGAAILASNDLSPTPFVVNRLAVSGIGPATGGAALTIGGNGLAFAGAGAQLNLNPVSGGSGYTVNLNSPLTFQAATAITFGSGGGQINTGGAWAGSGNVTFTGSLTSRALSPTATGTWTGDLTLAGSTSVLNLGASAGNLLGPNISSVQSVIVSSGSGVTADWSNAGAFNCPQNFILNGSGNSATSNAALNVAGMNSDAVYGGIATNTGATLRVAAGSAGSTSGLRLAQGLNGSGDLTKTGNGVLYLTTGATSTVTWGGTLFTGYKGNITITEGVIQTPATNNAMGLNPLPGNQRVSVTSGAALVIIGNTTAIQPQNMILHGGGTGFAGNSGGIAALDSYGVSFGNNQVRSIVVAADASVSVRRDAGPNGLGMGLSLQAGQGLAGNGTLTVGATYGSPTGTLFLSNAAAAVNEYAAFSGFVVVNNGMVAVGNAAALGSTTDGRVYLSGLGALAATGTVPLNSSFLARIANAPTTSGIIALGANSSNALDFSSLANARLGAINNSTYGGALTPAGGTYRLGGGGGTLTVSSALTGTNALVVGGQLTLASGGNDFNGGITIAGTNTGTGQTAQLNFAGGTGSLPANPITFSGIGGTFAYAGSASGSYQPMGALAFSEGWGTVTSTYGTGGNTELAFGSLAARTAGAAGAFGISGGVKGTTNKISIGGLATGLVDKGIFLSSGSANATYAYNDAGGFLRAPVYGTDPGFVTSGATTTLASAANQEITGAISAQIDATFNSLRISGAGNLTLASGIVSVDDLLKAGNNTVTISGGTGIRAATSSGELVIRADQAGDAITISNQVLDNGGSSLTKIGAGTLALSNSTGNNYSGGTTISQGTFLVSGGGLADSAAVTVAGGTYSVSASDTVGAVTLKNGVIGGAGLLTGASYALLNGAVDAVLAGTGSLAKTTEGYVYLSANNTYSGGTTVSAGALGLMAGGSFGTGPLTVSGGLADLGGRSITNTLGPLTGGGSIFKGVVTNDGGSYDVQNGTVRAALAGTNGLVKTTAGTVDLSGANAYAGPTTVSAGTLVISGGTINASASITVSTGATLASNAIAAISPALNLVEGSILAGTGSFQPVAMTVLADLAGSALAPISVTNLTETGTLTFALSNIEAGSYPVFSGSPSGGFSTVYVGATQLSGSGTFSGTDGTWSYTFTNAGNILAISAVPEPSACALLLIGCALALGGRRRCD